MENVRCAVARNVNSLMTASYWEIGRRIFEFEQAGKERAIYGGALISRLSSDLGEQFGRGFSHRNLEQMRLFYQSFPIPQTLSAELQASEDDFLPVTAPPSLAGKTDNLPIPQTLSGELAGGGARALKPLFEVGTAANISDLIRLSRYFSLPWSAYVRLLSVKNTIARNFYETEALRCGWSVRQLDRQINTQFYERLALSKNKVSMLKQGEGAGADVAINTEVTLRDPFVLEFLNLKDQYSESDLEEALIQNIADFLLELGDEFAFVDRQRRLRIDDKWFRVDLLFFHRRLKSLVVVDLKLGKFDNADVGQMNFYLNYARAHWVKPGENPPIGLILCVGKGEAEVHYALDNLQNTILASEYRTVLPDEVRLANEIDRARQRLEDRREEKQ